MVNGQRPYAIRGGIEICQECGTNGVLCCLAARQKRTAHLQKWSAQEKASQMVNITSAIARLGVPSHYYWNECLHGVARNGAATSLPQAIGMAAMWDTALMYRIATAISDEARAKHHVIARPNNGNSGQYQGLTFWSPNINIFRDLFFKTNALRGITLQHSERPAAENC